MPVTINGVGTHYYGRGNASAHRDTCDFCGRTATLTSYDTRECFCVLFIPLIPIAKYRIFDECSSCRKHRRVKFAEFQQQVASHVEPLREAVRRSPKDPAAHEALIRELAGMRMNADAETAAREAVRLLPSDAKMNMLAGQLLTSKGDLPAAAAFLERAVHFDGTNAVARASLGNVRYLERHYDAAAKQLDEAHRLAPSDHGTTYLLAECYMNLQRWPDALPLFQQLPNPDRALLRRIAECKKKLGYQLHDAERRAARRWWPFGGRSKQPGRVTPVKAASSSASGARVGIAVAAIAVLAIIGGGISAYYNTKHVTVWFDSVATKPAFLIDGERFTSDTALPWKKSVTPGRHQVKVVGRNGEVLDERRIDVQAPSFGDAIFGNRAYVFNTGGQRVYRRAAIDYTVSGNDAHYGMDLIGNKAFFEANDVDYMFVTPPKTVQMSSGTSRVTKRALGIEPDFTLYDYGMYRLQQDKEKEALAAFKASVQFNPCDTDSREMLATLRINAGAVDEGIGFAQTGITACPGRMIESHRVYQDAMRNAGRTEELVGIYRGQLAAHSDSAAHHYLLGRILPSIDEEIAEQREALRLDPKLGWAHGALGYSLLGAGNYDEAMSEFGAAMRNGLTDDRAVLHCVWSGVAAGRPAEARSLIEPAIRKQPYWMPRWLLALAEQKWTAAKSLYDERVKYDPKSVTTWVAAAQLYRLQGDEAAFEKHLAGAKRNRDLAATAAILRIEALIEDNKWDEAVAAIDAAAETLGEDRDLYEIYAAAASMLGGHMTAAQERINGLREQIEANEDLHPAYQAMLLAELDALSGSTQPPRVLDAVHDDLLQTKHAWFFLGAHAKAAGDAEHARDYFARSARASFDLRFPLLAARRLANS